MQFLHLGDNETKLIDKTENGLSIWPLSTRSVIHLGGIDMIISEKPVISVKIPIDCERMTDRQRLRLSRIVSRDTRIIKAYLGVIERHESEILVGKKRKRIDGKKLIHLTLTATRGDANRPMVPHDFKERFGNISVNELRECCDTAIAMWDSYLANSGAKPLQSGSYRSKKLPRFIFGNRFELVYTPDSEIKHWLRLRDSLDSVREGRRVHDRLMIPLSPSSYHLNQLGYGNAKSLRILKDRDKKWWAVFSVRLEVNQESMESRPQAVMGIDLGVKKAVCSVILTRNEITHVRYWNQKDKVSEMESLDRQVASLQQKRNRLQNSGLDASGVKKKLRVIRDTRENVSLDHDRKLVRKLASHILEMSMKYDLYVAIGRVRGIRNAARKGNYKGSTYRGMVHRWSFFRITESLKHKLSTEGFDERRILAVPEAWTSITCHKCGHKGLRPKQSYFLCHTCGYRDNADKNAAVNVGRRLIKLIPSLRDERGLGGWLQHTTAVTPKARRSSGSERMSPLPERSPTSLERKSVADCNNQTSPEGSESSTDPAMAKTVERPTVAGEVGNSCTIRQRKEAPPRTRSDTPMTASKGHVRDQCNSIDLAGDSSRDKGRTQKSKVDGTLPLYGLEGIRSRCQIVAASTDSPNIAHRSEVVTRVHRRHQTSYRPGEHMADRYNQAFRKESTSVTNIVMEKTAETPSVGMYAGEHCAQIKRTIARFREMDYIPSTSDKRPWFSNSSMGKHSKLLSYPCESRTHLLSSQMNEHVLNQSNDSIPGVRGLPHEF